VITVRCQRLPHGADLALPRYETDEAAVVSVRPPDLIRWADLEGRGAAGRRCVADGGGDRPVDTVVGEPLVEVLFAAG